MTRAGGESQAGRATAGGDPYGLAPSFALDCMVEALQPFQTSGAVKVVDRLTHPITEQKHLDKQLSAGLPAMLCSYAQSTFDPMSTSGRRFHEVLSFLVVCAAGSFYGPRQRLAGRPYEPGLDDLLRWARRVTARALFDVNGLSGVRLVRQRYLSLEAKKFVGVVELTGRSSVDLHSGDSTAVAILQRIGLVENPTDIDELFLPGDVPNTDDIGGVAELENA